MKHIKTLILFISGVTRGNGKTSPSPRNPGKLAKDGEQITPQPAVSLDIKRKFKFLLIFKTFY